MDIAPLKGIRVIALTWVWAGPWMGAVLADMGAEVIKIETNERLDTQRFIKVTKEVNKDINHGQFNITNRGVKSCTLNLKSARGVGYVRKASED